MSDDTDLEERASAGDTDAQYRLSVQLFEALAPEAFNRATSLIESAAANGHAEAISQLATLEATGAGRAQNFDRALELLEYAAELGSGHAQAQLQLLAKSKSTDWPRLRRAIDLRRLLSVPDKTIVCEEPRVRIIEGFASKAVCDWVIARTGHKLGRAMIWDEVGGMGRIDPDRSNSAAEVRLTDMDVAIEILRARIAVATRLPEPVFETPQVMHYTVGQEFKLHHDYLDPELPGHAMDMKQRGQRIATFLIYLNDGFEGGETEFPRADITVRGAAGDALFFANITRDGKPDPLTTHAGRSPTSGEKWILSQWIRDRSPGAPAP